MKLLGTYVHTRKQPALQSTVSWGDTSQLFSFIFDYNTVSHTVANYHTNSAIPNQYLLCVCLTDLFMGWFHLFHEGKMNWNTHITFYDVIVAPTQPLSGPHIAICLYFCWCDRDISWDRSCESRARDIFHDKCSWKMIVPLLFFHFHAGSKVGRVTNKRR